MDIFLIVASAIAGGSLTFIVMTFLHTTSGITVERSRPRRAAWLYPTGSILTLKDGREFIVDERQIRVYDEFGNMGDPKDYLYSKYKRYWRHL